jgi:outer membrane lipoprotein-sorting protein
MNIFTILWLLLFIPFNKSDEGPDAAAILQKVDDNLAFKTQILESEMVIYGRRINRIISSRSYALGYEKSFTEYLAPDREKGTKMLKMEDHLWIYSPETDRTIQLSGHMLRQSVMGSDLSYEDMMEERKLVDLYDATVIGDEVIDGRSCWVLELMARVEDVAYQKRKAWIDQERFVALREELFAKSGQLLKCVTLSKVQYLDGRWIPTRMNYKDVLKDGEGTDFIITDIKFDVDIPEYIFNKASLRK